VRRRTFVATAAGLGTTLLAGCSGDGGGGGGSGDGDGSGGGGDGDGGGGSSGSFRLLVSDQPAAIGDFDSLNVTLASARVFRADEDEEITPTAVNGTEAESAESPSNETMADEDGDDEDDEDGDDEDDEDDGDGFVEFDLDSATVDLTQVVGDRAVRVLEGELEAGRYSGIELSVAGTEGVVDGEPVEVKVPSGRLRIVRPFEVAADEELNFVFDINVVQRGPGGSYNLLPVVGKSGVAGDDIDVEEVDGNAEDDGDNEADEDDGDDEPTDGNGGNGGPPDDAGN